MALQTYETTAKSNWKSELKIKLEINNRSLLARPHLEASDGLLLRHADVLLLKRHRPVAVVEVEEPRRGRDA